MPAMLIVDSSPAATNRCSTASNTSVATARPNRDSHMRARLASSLRIVPVAVAVANSTLDGSLSTIRNVSSGSAIVSSITANLIEAAVCPGSSVSTPRSGS